MRRLNIEGVRGGSGRGDILDSFNIVIELNKCAVAQGRKLREPRERDLVAGDDASSSAASESMMASKISRGNVLGKAIKIK